MSERAVVYARVSTDDQRGNYSIPTQVLACLRYAQTRGYAIVGDRFVDQLTGRDTSSNREGAIRAYVDDFTSRELSRPSLDAAISYLETVGFDVIVVYALDRLARDPYIRQTLELEFGKRGAKVEFATGDYAESAEGEVRKDLDATFGKWENAKRVERCNRGKCRKAEVGLFVAGCPPYGYRIDKSALGGLAVVEKEAEVIGRVFGLYLDGKSIQGIADTLTGELVLPPHGGARWGTSTIAKILQNPYYVGRGFYNRRQRRSGRLQQRNREEWIEFQTTVLVPEWQFAEVQRRLDENKDTKRRQPRRFYLLSSMIFCDHCGRPYATQTEPKGKSRRAKEAQFYRHRTKEGHCTNRMISANRLEPMVWDMIVRVLLDPHSLRAGYEEALAQEAEKRERNTANLEALHRKVAKLKQQQQNLTAAYTDPDISITKSEYLTQRTKIDDELSEVSKMITELEKELADGPNPADREAMEAFGAQVRESINTHETLTPDVKREILKQLHVKVILGLNGTARLESWFRPVSTGLSSTSSTCQVIQDGATE